MRSYTYIVGLLAGFFLIAWLGSLLMHIPRHWVFLIAAIVFIILYVLMQTKLRKDHKKKMTDIIASYQNKKDDSPSTSESGESAFKGWGMNDSPYRERKSGLTWGSGNVHAANTTRGGRKKFLK